MKLKLNLALIISLIFLTGCEDAATRQSRKNRGAGQEATASSSEGFSTSVEQNRAQHLQANQEFHDVLTEFAQTVGSIKNIPTANQALPKCDPLMDKMDAIIKKVAGYPKLKSDEKAGLGDKNAQTELDEHLKRSFGGARGHLVLSDKQETFDDITARFKEIVKKSAKVMLWEINFRF